METVTTQTPSEAIEDIGKVAELMYNYGFVVIFCATILVVGVIVAIAVIVNSNKRHQATIKMEQEKNEKALALDETERMAHIKTNERMVTIVTDVQTQQIAQLQEMSTVLTSLKNELKISTSSIQDIGTSVTLINQSLSNLDRQYEHTNSDIGEMTKMIHDLHTIVVQLNTKIDTTIQIMKEHEKNDGM